MTEIKPHAAHWGYLGDMGHGPGEQGLAQGRRLAQRYASSLLPGLTFGRPAHAAAYGQG